MPSSHPLTPRRELWLLAPIAAVVLWMGVYPESFMAPMRADIATLVERLDRAKPAGDSRPTEARAEAVAAQAQRIEAAENTHAAHGEAH